jgi:hypothetical protein
MRYILDQNMARDNEIDEYLRNKNEIILINDFIIEPFKSLNYETILTNNLAIIKKYPQQIFVTFERGVLLRREWNTKYPIKINNIIDFEASELFRNILKNNISYNNIIKQMAWKRIDEQEDFVEAFIRSTVIKFSKKLEKMVHIYKNDKGKMINDIKETVFELLDFTFKEKGIMNYNVGIFRENISINFCQSFILVWRIIDWIIKRGAQDAKKAIRGDGFDIKYVVYACFFDGIFTREKWMKESREDLLNVFEK